jgi:choline dehydrogenase-like flavoprotein
MEHARDFSLTLEPADPALFREAGFYDMHRTAGSSVVVGRLGFSPDVLSELDLPNAAISVIPRRGSRARPSPVGRVTRLARRLRGLEPERRYGWSRAKFVDGRFDAFRLIVNLEHEPDFANRVSLGDRLDRHGNRLPHLCLRWTQQEQARLVRLRGFLDEALRASGLGSVTMPASARPDLSAHHHAGTTRMSDTVSDGVVDPDSRVFGLDNLYVTGASIMPRAGYANPTLTIVAVALRLAEHLDSVLD